MSGGRSTLWRTSLCGVVMALAAFSTGCAVDASSDAEDDAIEAQADLIAGSTDAPGAAKLGDPVDSPQAPTTTTITTTETKSPATSKVEELVEPEPDPWHPRSRAGSDSDKVSLGTRSGLSDDRK